MPLNYGRFVPGRSGVTAIAIVFALLGIFALNASAQEELASATTTTVPSAYFQNATLTGTTNTVNATLLPVVNSSGATVLENIMLKFGFNSAGQLIVSSLQAAPAPTPSVAGFMSGTYCGPATWSSGLTIAVSGPGVTSGGATEWTLVATPKAFYNTYPSSATWYVGSIANNPIYARIQAAGIKFTGWSYGFGGGYYGGEGADWYTNSLLSFSQVGNTLTIQSFTDNSGKDHSQPVNQVTYTACTVTN